MKALGQTLIRPLVALRGVLRRINREIREHNNIPAFANKPAGLVIQQPHRIYNPRRIELGDNVKLGPNSVLSAQTEYPGSWLRHPEGHHVSQTFEPRIVIGHRVTATSALQVVALGEIIIEDDVMFASNVFISDGTHAIHTADEPYKFQGMSRIAPIRIGRGSWIGQNVVFMPGVTVGEFSIVGANSVVTRDVPARSIAVGNPTRVVKRWNEDTHRWQPVTGD